MRLPDFFSPAVSRSGCLPTPVVADARFRTMRAPSSTLPGRCSLPFTSSPHAVGVRSPPSGVFFCCISRLRFLGVFHFFSRSCRTVHCDDLWSIEAGALEPRLDLSFPSSGLGNAIGREVPLPRRGCPRVRSARWDYSRVVFRRNESNLRPPFPPNYIPKPELRNEGKCK